MNDPTLEIPGFSFSSNTKDLKPVIDAVNATIRTDTLKMANQDGIENPGTPKYTAGELLLKYNYVRVRLGPNWYRHTFTLKPRQTK